MSPRFNYENPDEILHSPKINNSPEIIMVHGFSAKKFYFTASRINH